VFEPLSVERLAVTAAEESATVFIIDIAPILVPDISLVSLREDEVLVGVRDNWRAVLDATVDEARFGVSRELELTGELEVFVGLGGSEVDIFREAFVTIGGFNHAVFNGPIFGVVLIEWFPSVERFTIKEGDGF